MKNRLKSYYRYQRERVIRRKEFIINHVLNGEGYPVRGKLDKGKIHCSCWMCKFEKHYEIPKASHQAKWDAMKKDIEDFYNGEE